MRQHHETRKVLADIGLTITNRVLRCAWVKGGATEWRPVEQALERPYVDFNPTNSWAVDVFDIDGGRFESWRGFWEMVDAGVVVHPSWAVRTDNGLHVAYVWANPIHDNLTSKLGPSRYRRDVRDALTQTLGADMGFRNGLARSPVFQYRGPDTKGVGFIESGHGGFTLGDVVTPDVAMQMALMRDVAAADVNGRRRRPRTSMADLLEQARDVWPGERNCFLALPIRETGILWALDNEYQIESVIQRLNDAMPEPLGANEVAGVVRSAVKSYNAPGRRRRWKARRLGGLRSGSTRRERLLERDSYLRELADMPISQSQVSALLARRGQELHGADWIEAGYQLTQRGVGKALKRLVTGSQLL